MAIERVSKYEVGSGAGDGLDRCLPAAFGSCFSLENVDLSFLFIRLDAAKVDPIL